MRLFKDKKGLSAASKVMGMIGVLVAVIAGLYMTPTIAYEVDYIIFQNASAWNFTGHAGAESLLGLIPFVWVAGLLIFAVVAIFTIAKSSG